MDPSKPRSSPQSLLIMNSGYINLWVVAGMCRSSRSSSNMSSLSCAPSRGEVDAMGWMGVSKQGKSRDFWG